MQPQSMPSRLVDASGRGARECGGPILGDKFTRFAMQQPELAGWPTAVDSAL
jgi:hypothetical protein